MKNEDIEKLADALLARGYMERADLVDVIAAYFGESAPEQKFCSWDQYIAMCEAKNAEIDLLQKEVQRLQPLVAPSVDTNAEKCAARVEKWYRNVIIEDRICGNTLPCADHPADAPQEPTCARGDDLSPHLCQAPKSMHCDLTNDADHLDDMTFCPLLHHAFLPPVVESSVLPSKSEGE